MKNLYQIKKADRMIVALCHPIRQDILCFLSDRDSATVTEIIIHMRKYDQPQISSHMKYMRDAKIVSFKKQGAHVHYFDNFENIKAIDLMINRIANQKTENPDVIARDKLKCLINPNYRNIINLVGALQPIDVTSICEKLNLSQSICSQRLQLLRTCNMVTTQRDGKRILYSVNQNEVDYVIEKCVETVEKIL